MSVPPKNAVVWAEIPVTDMDRAMAFYATVTGQTLNRDDTGPNPMATFAYAGQGAGVAGHLYPGKPAAKGTGATIHLAVEGTVEAAIERLDAAGGETVSPVIQIPAGRFAYALDPDGNSIGLFEATA